MLPRSAAWHKRMGTPVLRTLLSIKRMGCLESSSQSLLNELCWHFKYSTVTTFIEASWNVMTHAQKPDFVFRRNGRVHLKRRGRGGQFSRLLAAEVCAWAVVMLDTPCSEVVWRVLATHCIRQFPLHFPSLRHLVQSHFNWSLKHVLTASYFFSILHWQHKTNANLCRPWQVGNGCWDLHKDKEFKII